MKWVVTEPIEGSVGVLIVNAEGVRAWFEELEVARDVCVAMGAKLWGPEWKWPRDLWVASRSGSDGGGWDLSVQNMDTGEMGGAHGWARDGETAVRICMAMNAWRGMDLKTRQRLREASGTS